MGTVTVWLLINLGAFYKDYTVPTVLVERFATADECMRVAKVINDSSNDNKPKLRCVEAKVVR